MSLRYTIIITNTERASAAIQGPGKVNAYQQCSMTVTMTTRLTPGMAQSPVSLLLIATNSRMGFPASITLSPLSSRCHRDTIGSAAWLGPQRPSKPRPFIPVRPIGFLNRQCNTHGINLQLVEQDNEWVSRESNAQMFINRF